MASSSNIGTAPETLACDASAERTRALGEEPDEAGGIPGDTTPRCAEPDRGNRAGTASGTSSTAPPGATSGESRHETARPAARLARRPPDALEHERLPASTDRALRTTRPDESIDARLGVAFRRARDLIERESGADLAPVSLQLVDDTAMLDEVTLETRRLVHGQLGEGPLAERLLATLMRNQAGTYAALYAGRRPAVMVSREVLGGYLSSLSSSPAARDEALLVLMLHELVHAADDVSHRIHADRTLDFRASFAQSAAFEGHAQWLTRKICRREGCLGGLDALDAFMFGDTEAPAPLDRNLLEYSYVEGERFVTALAARPDGPALLERLLADPPHDPLQILDPGSFPDEARERRNRALLRGALGIDHPWFGGPDARVAVATSPLKGVNLRDDPSRREAAIDGFTRLVTAMVAVQFHDAGDRALPPIEVTVMRTDRPATARLFADSLNAHARMSGAELPPAAGDPHSDDLASADPSSGGPFPGGESDAGRQRAALRRTALASGSAAPWRTTIGTTGNFVVQASGRAATPDSMDDYVLGVLAALLDEETA